MLCLQVAAEPQMATLLSGFIYSSEGKSLLFKALAIRLPSGSKINLGLDAITQLPLAHAASLKASWSTLAYSVEARHGAALWKQPATSCPG